MRVRGAEPAGGVASREDVLYTKTPMKLTRLMSNETYLDKNPCQGFSETRMPIGLAAGGYILHTAGVGGSKPPPPTKQSHVMQQVT